MPFFAFRLDRLHILNQRGKSLDKDVVTFTVIVNQIERARAAATIPGLATGTVLPISGGVVAGPVGGSIAADVDWVAGPFELASDDNVSVIYSGTNVSDDPIDLNDSQQQEIEVKILDTIASAGAGAVGGLTGAVLSGVLGAIGDPIGKFLGFKPEGPCNGLVFSDKIDFEGGALPRLPFQPNGGLLSGSGVIPIPVSGPPLQLDILMSQFTRPYTDEATHNTSVCGDVAHTEVTFSVLEVPWVSVRAQLFRLFPSTFVASVGVRKSTLSSASSLRSLIGLRP
jgi:hypothetical protein